MFLFLKHESDSSNPSMHLHHLHHYLARRCSLAVVGCASRSECFPITVLREDQKSQKRQRDKESEQGGLQDHHSRSDVQVDSASSHLFRAGPCRGVVQWTQGVCASSLRDKYQVVFSWCGLQSQVLLEDVLKWYSSPGIEQKTRSPSI